ncbi:adenylate/guanylate cyclase domain-containing protein [Rhodococcus spelaei]|uniref:Adenylate/guanylate cyclase domain-containing protein n=1 Tax=Rhodococcus spelaei TaxID=2546320 RepID=A0A541BMT7_9NOCA|nr:adenylate/guanylate cyclase domain-containing protein [Rhodococcus spelaei]
MFSDERPHTKAGASITSAPDAAHEAARFTEIVRGLAERERLHDLLCRHVGRDVARRALEYDALPERNGLAGGEVVEAAVLFIDLVGSTTLAATRPPNEVATVLNEFFRVVVTAVEGHHGFVNKFEGDAALAIFGAPRPVADPAGLALATARSLRHTLGALHSIDFGIGVSFGEVFAGNIGAEERYEYTVIGDPVNEAARLTGVAKTCETRTSASGHAVDAAAEVESRHWTTRRSITLRGRTEPTVLAEPVEHK